MCQSERSKNVMEAPKVNVQNVHFLMSKFMYGRSKCFFELFLNDNFVTSTVYFDFYPYSLYDKAVYDFRGHFNYCIGPVS